MLSHQFAGNHPCYFWVPFDCCPHEGPPDGGHSLCGLPLERLVSDARLSESRFRVFMRKTSRASGPAGPLNSALAKRPPGRVANAKAHRLPSLLAIRWSRLLDDFIFLKGRCACRFFQAEAIPYRLYKSRSSRLQCGSRAMAATVP